MNHDEEIRLIAYRIWEGQGRQAGYDLEHWLKAEAMWQEQTYGHQAQPGQSRHRAPARKVAGSSTGEHRQPHGHHEVIESMSREGRSG
jgi:hypothetical protein